MATPESGGRTAVLVDRVRAVIRGSSDLRVRATWRVLLAMPVLWILTGGVLAANVQAAVPRIPHGPNAAGGLAQSLLHAGFFVVALAGWARYLDRRPLSEYGVSAAPEWGLDLLAGFVAVVLGFVAWLALGSLLEETALTVSTTATTGSALVTLALVAVALVLHAAVQQVVFFRVILGTTAEGLHSRGVAVARALAGAVPVAVVLFVAMHGSAAPLRVLDLAIAGTVFGLLFVHTGDLGLGIGAHFGALYAGNVLFVPAANATGEGALFQVTGALPGVLGTVDQYGFPKMMVAYLVLLAWIRWRRGEVTLGAGIAESNVE